MFYAKIDHILIQIRSQYEKPKKISLHDQNPFENDSVLEEKEVSVNQDCFKEIKAKSAVHGMKSVNGVKHANGTTLTQETWALIKLSNTRNSLTLTSPF
jgi:hypothetical protein